MGEDVAEDVIDLLSEDEAAPRRKRPRRIAAAAAGDVVNLSSDDDGDVVAVRRRPSERPATSAAPVDVVTLSDGNDDDDDDDDGFPAEASSLADVLAPWQRPAGEITCPICFCDTPAAEAAALGACNHAFCVECITHFVKGKVKAGEVMGEQLSCPCVEPEKCGVALLPGDVKRALGARCRGERYERLVLQRCVDEGDDLGCCPSAGCGFMFAWEKDNRKLDCPLCKKSFCLVCRTEPWHQGVRCEQFQAERGDTDASDASFASFAKSHRLRQCPSCSFWVEKQGGCDAMHCRCNFVFCYTCGGVLKKTAAATGASECICGAHNQQLLQAHDGAPNMNNQPAFPFAPGAGMPHAPNVGGMMGGMLGMYAGMYGGGRGGRGDGGVPHRRRHR